MYSTVIIYIYIYIYSHTHTHIYIYIYIYIYGFPGDLVVKNLPPNAEETGSIPGSGRSPEEGNGKPLQYSFLGNPMETRACQAIVHGVVKESDMT